MYGGAVPLLTSDCLTEEPACCDSLFAFADNLRTNAMDALSQCFVDGRCGALFSSYVSMGFGDDGVADSLIVAVNQMNPSPGTQPVGLSLWQMTFDVRLRESGYPVVQSDGGGRTVAMPDPGLQHQATRQLMAHGEAIHKRLSNMKALGQLAPQGYVCAQGTIGQMLPLIPQGGVAGWTILVTINMPWS